MSFHTDNLHCTTRTNLVYVNCFSITDALTGISTVWFYFTKFCSDNLTGKHLHLLH